MIYFRFNIGKLWNNLDSTGQWFNYSAGIWMFDLEGLYPELNNEDYDTIITLDVVEITSVLSDNVELDKIASISALQDNPGYYFDKVDKRIYLRLSNFENPDYHNINIGLSEYLSDEPYIDASNNIYKPYLIPGDFSKIVINRDPLYKVNGSGENIISTDTFTVGVTNAHLLYNTFNLFDVYKQPVTAGFIYNGVDYKLFSGYLNTYSIGGTLQINAMDKKQSLDEYVTESYYLSSDYPDLHPDDDFKPQPMRWGNCYKVPVLCVTRGIYNPASSQTLQFHAADTIFHDLTGIDAFYINDISKTIATKDLTTGIFTYSKASGEEIDFDKCTATIRGYKDDSGMFIQNPADIIKDILLNTSDKTYNATNYNISKWSEVRTKLHDAYLDTSDEDVLTCIARVIAQNATFIIEPDGRYSLSKQDFTASPAYTIPKEYILNLTQLSEAYDPSEVFGIIKLEYANGQTYINTTNKQYVIDKFRTKNVFTYKTSLSSSTHIENLSDEIANVLKEIRPVYRIELPIEKWYMLKIDDIISVEIDKVVESWRGYRNLIIESIEKDPLNYVVYINARYVGETTIEPSITASVKLGGEIMGGEMVAGGPI